MIKIFGEINYTCPSAFLQGGQCIYNGLVYPCDAGFDSTTSSCMVRGVTVLNIYKGVSSTDEWFQAGILVVILVSFRLLTYFMLRFPWSFIKSNLMNRLRQSPLTGALLEQEATISSLAARVQVLEHGHQRGHPPQEQVIELGSISKPGPSLASFNSVRTSLRWHDLRLELRTSGQILVDNLEGEAKPGRVLAIMGPSGAGKTTMLNALSGRAPYAKITGSVLLGSRPLSKEHLDYVPQFDVLNPAMTVKQTFCIMAKLKNTRVDCRKRVAELLIILGLTAHGDEVVGQLSSGDRKRVSIGLGLISNPSVLFLDEPTTGLDSEAALVVVDYCIKVARSTGVVCIMTIHQPSANIFNQLDDLLLLTKGQTAYFGSASQAQSYFTDLGFPVPPNTNPSDHFLDLVNAKSINDIRQDSSDDIKSSGQSVEPSDLPNWKEQFLKSSHATGRDVPVASEDGGKLNMTPPRPSEWVRLSVLVGSKIVYYWQERAIYLFRLVELVILAIFIGTLFLRLSVSVTNLNEIAGAMFFNVWVVLFAAIGATPIFVRDRLSFENEYLNGAYEISTYCLSIMIASLPYHLVTAIIYQTMVWFLVGFNDSFEPWLFAVLSTLSLLLLMEGVSLIVVELLKNAMLSTTFTMVVLGMFFLFPGFFIKVPDMVKSIFWLSWIVPTKYSLDSQLYNILHGQNYDSGSPSPSIPGDMIASEVFKLDMRNKWGDWGIVIAYVVFFRLLHYLVIRYHYRKFAKGQLAEH